MTPLDIAVYTVLEDLVLDSLSGSLSGSFPAAAHVSGQLYVGVPRTFAFWEGML